MRFFLQFVVIVLGAAPLLARALPDVNCLLQGGGANVLGGQSALSGSALGWQQGIKCANSSSELENTKIYYIIKALMLWSLSLIGILAVIAFVIAGVLYLTAAGDESQTDRAKKTMRYAIYGILIALGGVIVITAIDKALSGSSDF